MLALNAKDPAASPRWRRGCGAGRSVVLVGSSGAGKSTLTNTLLGIERMKTGAVRDSDARGRHTTTHRALLPLPSGACLIDTPGMRELKPTGEEDVAESFADVEALAEQCRFRDCKHAKRARLRGARGDRERRAGRRSASPTSSSCRDEVAGAANRLATRLAQKADAKVLGKTKAQSTRNSDERHGRH